MTNTLVLLGSSFAISCHKGEFKKFQNKKRASFSFGCNICTYIQRESERESVCAALEAQCPGCFHIKQGIGIDNNTVSYTLQYWKAFYIDNFKC